ncbi:MAG: elongation factor P maturation arginine rhamnosyltransferase EarP [Azonexus sp.]
MAAMQRHWDIFCRVIDNYGDIGVCWRLARQLVAEHGLSVRLWVDDPGSLKPLAPSLDSGLSRQMLDGVEVAHWRDDFVVDRVADVVIEAFACELPGDYVQAMAKASAKPTWINLEYLTAESWADGCHGMASPHPTLSLSKYFFFPGFSATTGGLLREKNLPPAGPNIAKDTLDISLFCYETAPVGELLEILGASPIPVRLHVAPGKPLAAVVAHWGKQDSWLRGNLQVLPFAFLPQDGYDALLRRCDINFVRGEDSFVRAQWAGKPFIWQIYRQDDAAHKVKLEAFLERYTAGWDGAAANAAARLMQAWNSGNALPTAWQDFIVARHEIARHNRLWADSLAARPDLAEALVNFCALKV